MVDLDGKALIADAAAFGGDGGLIRVDPVSGASAALSRATRARRATLFVDPSGMAVMPPSCSGVYATIVGTECADAITGTRAPT